MGRLVELERGEALLAGERADEAERLRDDLGRRIDLLEATNRAARALGSSLDLDEAFSAFTQELRGLVPFDRAAILLLEGDTVRVMATAGLAADHVQLDRRDEARCAASILEEVIARRPNDLPRGHEPTIVYAGGVRAARARAPRRGSSAPLQLGHALDRRALARAGASRHRSGPTRSSSSTCSAASSRRPSRTCARTRRSARRWTEVRRLAALRADFVSLVSHELRSPMAAVIGSALTLQQRWRELRPDQREAFLAVIADETTRLSVLVGDVLDTSRIEAGTFGYAFSDVDLAQVVRESVAAAELGQDEVRLKADLAPSLPHVRGDAERLRQLVDNLISNAVKFSTSGGRGARRRPRRQRARDRAGRRRRTGHPGRASRSRSSRSSAAPSAARSPAAAWASSSRGRSPRRTAGRSGVDSRPGEGAAFTLTIPLESEQVPTAAA